MKALNLKNMKETYINMTGSNEEMERIYNAFWEMSCLGFVKPETWTKFFNWAYYLHMSGDGESVLGEHDEIIWTYNPGSEYHA